MSVKMVGVGSQYAYTEHDAAGRYLDGGKVVPPAPAAGRPGEGLLVGDRLRPADALDAADRPALPQRQQPEAGPRQSTPTPRWTSTSVRSRPPATRANWVQTVPGKGWFVILRLYGPLEPWFDKTWRPGEIEPVDE